jgi:hypothetical protein
MSGYFFSYAGANGSKIAVMYEDELYMLKFPGIACLVGIALGTLCGGALLETWEGMGWFTGGLDRVKALVILSTVLRVLVAVCLVPPLENDRDETMGHMLSDIAGGVLRRKPRA